MTSARRIVTVAVTARGRALAAQLPFQMADGPFAETVRQTWAAGDVDGLVLFAATGIVVRVIGPLLDDKDRDPAVVTVDETGETVIALCGGHAGGANALARQVAALLGARPIVTTASDVTGVAALDQLPGFGACGDVAAVMAARLDGRSIKVTSPDGWPVPAALAPLHSEHSRTRSSMLSVLISDRTHPEPLPASVVLHPPSLIVGIGTSTDATPEEARGLVDRILGDSGLAPASVAIVATVDRRASHPAVTSLHRRVEAFTPSALATVAVPNPNEAVRDAVGTPSVAEAAALLAAGPGSALVVPKVTGERVTVAVARASGPRGSLTLVGLGPGSPALRTPESEEGIRRAQVVVGYSAYVDQCADLLTTGQEVIRSPLGAEMDRARQALDLAAAGKTVAMVCSGDAGVYAMASPVLELADSPRYCALPVIVLPGITAGTLTAALLGAPLGHDHALISLSDLLTPWSIIERRVRSAASGDFVVVFYNPRSRRRTWQLDRALALLAEHRDPETPVGMVTDAGRDRQATTIATLATFDPTTVSMTSCVIVGSSTTYVDRRGRLVTPRGYPARHEAMPPDLVGR